MAVITRFAPSPTGFLHIGGVRTALFSWLFAKHHQGQSILRIEDTDRARSTQASVDAITQGLAWLGLTFDKGPYFQTDKFNDYKAAIDQLLPAGKAYLCTCTAERLDALRAEQLANKQKPRYDGHCRELNLAADITEPYVIRFKNPVSGSVSFNDGVHGVITVANEELDDFIIARTDGTPTYNFTVVIDDRDMGVTDVVRGDDHINNTPRQINLFRALDAKIPNYAHLPMILGPDNKRLSKRHGAVSVLQYREEGYLAPALLNYLVRLGWSAGDQEIFSLQEMIKLFDLTHVNKSPAAVNPDKLLWLNQHYIKTLPEKDIEQELTWHLQKIPEANLSSGPELSAVIAAQRERAKTIKEMAQKSLYLYVSEVDYNPEAAKKFFKASLLPVFQALLGELEELSHWDEPLIDSAIKSILTQFALKLGKLGPALRVALTGDTVSPPLTTTIELLGKEKTLARLRLAIKRIEQSVTE